jgi:hypothetical protein
LNTKPGIGGNGMLSPETAGFDTIAGTAKAIVIAIAFEFII